MGRLANLGYHHKVYPHKVYPHYPSYYPSYPHLTVEVDDAAVLTLEAHAEGRVGVVAHIEQAVHLGGLAGIEHGSTLTTKAAICWLSVGFRQLPLDTEKKYFRVQRTQCLEDSNQDLSALERCKMQSYMQGAAGRPSLLSLKISVNWVGHGFGPCPTVCAHETC